MALVKSIEFNDLGEPEAVTMRLTADEAAFIARVTGKQSHDAAEEVFHGGGVVSSTLYDATTAFVFEPYWEGGVDDYVSERGLHT